MARKTRPLIPLDDRGPLRVLFLITSMPVGGAETLLVNLLRRLDRQRFRPVLACLKAPGPLGEELMGELPVYHDLIRNKFDAGVISRLYWLFRRERIDALVTVGAGDKMFWGRLAARRARLPVVMCALHSTGWPDAIGRLNRSRLLARWTDAFIGVAEAHGKHLVEVEGFDPGKVRVIPNGVDVERFRPVADRQALRVLLGLPVNAPLVGIVAALRPEKNHALFLRAAARVRSRHPEAQFLIVGEGPERPALEQLATELKIAPAVHFLGSRADIPELLATLDVFALTSKIEANPVSILEAMATEVPVVAPDVGSIAESVIDGQTGFLTPPNDEAQAAERISQLLASPELARRMGQAGRRRVTERASLERMVTGYEQLLSEIYNAKAARANLKAGTASAASHPPRPLEAPLLP
jgi:glycosyltransferase involved in cell wall biosynthesis